MTRERWEQILFAHVPDEVVQDMLNAYVLELEAETAKLRELARFIMHQCNDGNPRCDECINWNGGECVVLQRMRELGVTDG